MSQKKIEISVLNDSDIDHVNDFHNSIYKSKRSRDEFLWEFINAPAGKAIYIVARDSDNKQIVGTQSAIPIVLITYSGEKVLTAKSEDTLVHPDYRGLNIFENMYQVLFKECKKKGMKYIWGFTSAKKPFLRLGFSIPFDHSQSLMVKNVLASYRYLADLTPGNSQLSRFKIFALCLLSWIYSNKKYRAYSKSNKEKFHSFVTDKSFVQDTSELLQNSIDEGYSINLDLTFMNWRLANNPYHDKLYSIYFSSESKNIAYFSFNHHKNGVWYLINDLYTNELSIQQKTFLLNNAVRILFKKEKANINLVRTLDFTHNKLGKQEVRIRKRTGFVHLNRGISFVWKSLDENNVLDPNKFHLSRIATQGVV